MERIRSAMRPDFPLGLAFDIWLGDQPLYRARLNSVFNSRRFAGVVFMLSGREGGVLEWNKDVSTEGQVQPVPLKTKSSDPRSNPSLYQALLAAGLLLQ